MSVPTMRIVGNMIKSSAYHYLVLGRIASEDMTDRLLRVRGSKIECRYVDECDRRCRNRVEQCACVAAWEVQRSAGVFRATLTLRQSGRAK